MLHRIWRRLKVVRKVRLGPASIVFRLEKTVAVRRRSWFLASTVPSATATALLPTKHEKPVLSGTSDSSQRSASAGRRELALVVGAGPGFGVGLAGLLAEAGMNVALASRDRTRIDRVANDLRKLGVQATAHACDATDERSVDRLFRSISDELGVPDLVVYALQEFGPGCTIDIEVPAFESAWRHNCLGAFLIARGAARLMKQAGKGTIALIGSTSAMIGREAHLNLAVGKFGQRALAQVLAREMGPSGVHVVHVVIDADIREGEPEDFPQAEPRDLAQAVLFLHRQPRSAWTSELDLRPSAERFWEHC